MGTAVLLVRLRPAISPAGPARLLDLSLAAALGAIVLQLVPLPTALVSLISPARVEFARTSALRPELPSFVPLTLDPASTLHALLAACAFAGTFWAARTIFAQRGIRTVITGLAWTAIVLVIVAFAQAATGTDLVYGVWRPYDEGARPLGPFVNRNHFGTWSLLVFFMCLGCLQWRRAAGSPPRGWSWRARLAHALDGRSLVLALAMVLLVLVVGFGASRSTLLALAGGAGYVAATAPGGYGLRRTSVRTAALGLSGLLLLAAYADVNRLLSRVDETRQLGLSQRVAIWRDTLRVIHDFPLAGAGAGAFSKAMRVYQTTDRTYYWNEAHNEYLQIAAEGGLLLVVPAGAGLGALTVLAFRTVRRRQDPVHWLRLGATAALVAVAIQAVWETGLTLPANAMAAAVAAALAIHPARTPADDSTHLLPRQAAEPRHRPHAASRD